MKIIKKNLKWVTIVGIVFFIITSVILKAFLNRNALPQQQIEELIVEKPEEPVETIPANIYVDIKGAVLNPGVYEIEDGKKVIDVIQLAGGLTDQADTTLINLAKKVTNEMVVIIYTLEEVRKAMEENSVAKIIDNKCICPSVKNDACLVLDKGTQSQNSSSSTNEEEEKIININTASLEELESLPGIGESKAKAILEYRTEHGNFSQIEDLKEVSGIGEALYEKVKDYITV